MAVTIGDLVVVLLVLGLIFWLVWWFIGFVGLPEPFNKVLRVVVGLVVLLFLIGVLLDVLGHPVLRL